MKFPKTPDVKGLVFSPWELRPGTPVTASYSYVDAVVTEWDSDQTALILASGTVYPTSVKSDWPIPEEDIGISVSGLWSTVTVNPIYHGVIPLTVFYKIDRTESLTAVSAITEATATFYNDWFTDEDGNTVPMTVVPLSLPVNIQVYKPEDFTVVFDQPERGISVINEEVWTSNSAGTVKMTDPVDDFAMTKNLFRKGLVQVEVPMAATIEPIIRYTHVAGGRKGKIVEVDLQEWDPVKIDVRGILWHRDKLYVLTENGLYRFDRWGDFAAPEAHYPAVTGNDLTYAPGDLLLVTDGSVKVYKIRHDVIHLDRDTDTMRFREANPSFKIG